MRVLRHVVPIDGQPHALPVSGRVVHVDQRQDRDVVELWAEDFGVKATTVFQVFGTGHQIDGMVNHCGTVLDREGGLVWHLYERPRR